MTLINWIVTSAQAGVQKRQLGFLDSRSRGNDLRYRGELVGRQEGKGRRPRGED